MRGRLVEGYVAYHNNVRLNAATDYITPRDMLAGRRSMLSGIGSWKRPGTSVKHVGAKQHEATLSYMVGTALWVTQAEIVVFRMARP
jgi:hypothetical protein